MISTKVGSTALITNTYKDNNGLLASSLFANGDTVAYGYNNLGLVSVVAQNGSNKYKWSYNSAGTPMLHQDLVNNEKYLYTYDSIGRLIRYDIQSNDTSSHIGTTEFAYDVRNNLSRIYLEFGGKSVAAQYKYSAVDENSNSAAFAKDNLPTQFYINSSRHVTYNYNAINQLTRRNISTTRPINYNYTYKSSDRNAEDETTYRTNLLARETIDNTTYNYTYDDIGNITKITKGERYTTDDADSFGTKNNVAYRSYVYDDLNQLTRENNKTSNISTKFEYDGIGNITKKTEYAYTTGTLGTATKTVTYRYGKDGKTGWNNLLTGVDLNGNGTYSTSETISYDEIGNPTSYLGNTLTWNGRQLKKYVGNGNTINYTYDADGYRATKTVNGNETIYRYVNGQLVYEEKPDGRQLFYLYDSYGYLTAIRYYNGDTSTLVGYYVTTNAQGDVIGIYNADGALRASYEYDAWGNIIAIKDGSGNTVTSSTHIAMLNSIRYRSYCYDNETGLYYVVNRYYNPQVGRFVNSDAVISGIGGDVLGYNVFAYCMNNPVNMSDPTGNWPKWIETAANWVNENIIQPVKNFFSPSSAVAATANNLPPTGEPGSSQTLPNPDGTPKQKRWYGPDGNAVRDRDYNHPGKGIPFPHDHEWKNGQRQKDHLLPSPDYEFSIEPVLGVGLVTICVVGIVVVAADDATGIGVADDFLFGPLGAGVGEGLILIFG